VNEVKNKKFEENLGNKDNEICFEKNENNNKINYKEDMEKIDVDKESKLIEELSVSLFIFYFILFFE
jgi:hypothetical protein